MSVIKKISEFFSTAALHYRAYKILIRNKRSYLYTTAWMQSLAEGKPIDNSQNAIPWMNFNIVELLDQRLNKNLNLFEFGSGYSTYFYADRVRCVTSLEYDSHLYQLLKPQVAENVKLIFQQEDIDGDYCRVIVKQQQKFDVVVVDGRDRVNCIKQSFASLSEQGVILLDDSQRERYQEGIELAEAEGFRVLHMSGLKATGGRAHRTTILYRDGNCLGI